MSVCPPGKLLLVASMLLWCLWLFGGAPAVGTGVRLSDCLLEDDYDQLLQAVQTGLPPLNASHHVVVVGAGMAGLTVAKLLQDAGHQVDGDGGEGGGACRPEALFHQKSTGDLFTFISMATR